MFFWEQVESSIRDRLYPLPETRTYFSVEVRASHMKNIIFMRVVTDRPTVHLRSIPDLGRVLEIYYEKK